MEPARGRHKTLAMTERYSHLIPDTKKTRHVLLQLRSLKVVVRLEIHQRKL